MVKVVNTLHIMRRTGIEKAAVEALPYRRLLHIAHSQLYDKLATLLVCADDFSMVRKSKA